MDGTAVSAPAAPAAPQEDFESLLAPVVERAYGTALRLAGEAADAEDLVQEAALRAFQAFHQYRQGTNFRAWFFRILLNCFYASRRRKRPETSLDALEAEGEPLYLYSRTWEAGLHAPGRDPAREVLDRIAGEDAARAVASLPDEFRVVATLYFMDDFSYQEIANVLDVPVGTVRSRLHRGRKLLQKALWEVATDAGLVPARGEDA